MPSDFEMVWNQIESEVRVEIGEDNNMDILMGPSAGGVMTEFEDGEVKGDIVKREEEEMVWSPPVVKSIETKEEARVFRAGKEERVDTPMGSPIIAASIKVDTEDEKTDGVMVEDGTVETPMGSSMVVAARSRRKKGTSQWKSGDQVRSMDGVMVRKEAFDTSMESSHIAASIQSKEKGVSMDEAMVKLDLDAERILQRLA